VGVVLKRGIKIRGDWPTWIAKDKKSMIYNHNIAASHQGLEAHVQVVNNWIPILIRLKAVVKFKIA
jgi:hypothetical protein